MIMERKLYSIEREPNFYWVVWSADSPATILPAYKAIYDDCISEILPPYLMGINDKPQLMSVEDLENLGCDLTNFI